jgi:hypothetical protein
MKENEWLGQTMRGNERKMNVKLDVRMNVKMGVRKSVKMHGNEWTEQMMPGNEW